MTDQTQTTEECSPVETYTDADGVVWERRWVTTRPGMQQLCWCTTAPACLPPHHRGLIP